MWPGRSRPHRRALKLRPGGAKLADFDIASVAGDPQLTATGTIIGSPAFMAPEQATGSRSVRRRTCGHWGHAVFAVEAEPPFNKAEPLATLTAMLNEPLLPAMRAGSPGPVLERPLSKAGGEVPPR